MRATSGSPQCSTIRWSDTRCPALFTPCAGDVSCAARHVLARRACGHVMRAGHPPWPRVASWWGSGSWVFDTCSSTRLRRASDRRQTRVVAFAVTDRGLRFGVQGPPPLAREIARRVAQGTVRSLGRNRLQSLAPALATAKEARKKPGGEDKDGDDDPGPAVEVFHGWLSSYLEADALQCAQHL